MRWTVLLVLFQPALICGAGWRARQCCREALVPRCRSGCKRATSAADLRRFCRQSDEAELFRCVKERKRAKSTTRETKNADESTSEEVQCCLKASRVTCRAACTRTRLGATSDGRHTTQLDQLRSGPCSQDVGFRECYDGGGTRSAARPVHRLELMCCHLADSDKCRRLCGDTYSLGWHHQGPRFERQCLSREYGELRLRRCIRDAEVPCQPNSGRLQFCGDFIEGSTGLYRRWDEQADDRAKTQYINWYRRGKLDVPFPNMSILTTAHCKTELRLLACFTHLQPCRSDDHSVEQICRSDCLRLSERCLDPAGGVTDIEAFCTLLSGPEERCVPIPPTQSPQGHKFQISSPCLPSPCEPGYVCRVGQPNHSTYVCLPGCRLSSVSGRMTAVGSTVLLPSVGARRKLSLLMCAPGGRLVECTTLSIPQDLPCNFLERKIRTGSVLQDGCRTCVCVDGAMACRSTGECHKSSRSLRIAPTHDTAASLHVHNKRCDSDLSLPYDPCEVRPCPPAYRCIPRPELCVDSLQPCAQQTCVPESSDVILSAVARCKQSVVYATSLEENTQERPFMACPEDLHYCTAQAHNCSLGAPSYGPALRLYFSGRRLAALGARVAVRAVLAALSRLVTTADCRVAGQLTAARQLTVTVTSEGGATSARACRLEAEKLRAWLVTASPVASVEPSLWPVMYAELVREPGRSTAATHLRQTLTPTVAVVVAVAVVLL